jgi:hypothetical protein
MSDDVYTRTDRRRGEIKGEKRRPTRRRGLPPFNPSEDQRHVVASLAGLMSWEDLCKLVIHPRTKKPISRDTLARTFRDELDVGKSRLKRIVLDAYRDIVINGQHHARWNAVEWGLSHICGFRDNAPSGVHLSLDDSNGRKLDISFVLPDQRRIAMEDLQYAEGEKTARNAPPISRATPMQDVLEDEMARNERLRNELSKLRIEPDPERDIVIEKNMPASMKKTYGGYE